MIRPGKKDPTILFEGRIEKKWAVIILIMGMLLLVVTYTIRAWALITAFLIIVSVGVGIYALWVATNEKLLFEDEQITYVSGKKTISYKYKDIHTVYILKRSPGSRGLYNDYLIIPVGESSAARRRRIETLVSNNIGLGEARKLRQFGHLFCSIRNENEKEQIVLFLHNRVNIIWE